MHSSILQASLVMQMDGYFYMLKLSDLHLIPGLQLTVHLVPEVRQLLPFETRGPSRLRYGYGKYHRRALPHDVVMCPHGGVKDEHLDKLASLVSFRWRRGNEAEGLPIFILCENLRPRDRGMVMQWPEDVDSPTWTRATTTIGEKSAAPLEARQQA